jgi:hypothetical protein
VGKPTGKVHLVDREGDGKIAIRWILGKWDVKMLIGWIWLRILLIGRL